MDTRGRHSKEKISVVMPAYNEEYRITAGIETTAIALNDLPYAWEILVMDDGSTDKTYDVARSAASKLSGHVLVKKHALNRGKGRAVKRAMRYVSGDYVVFLDADMDLHPMQIEMLFTIMRLLKADVVIGSKMHPNSQVNYPLQRRIISVVYYWLINFLFHLPCHDTQTGLKLFKTDVLRNVMPRILIHKFAFDLEVLVNAAHLQYRIAEAPIVLRSQRSYSRIGLKAMVTTLWDTLAVFYRMRVSRYYDRINYHRRKNMVRHFRRMRR